MNGSDKKTKFLELPFEIKATIAKLIFFFKWTQSHSAPSWASFAQSPLLLLPLLPSLFQYHKIHKRADAISLLVSFISSGRQHVLHGYFVKPGNWDPKKYGIKTSKLLFDSCISAYVESGKPHLAAQIFSKIKRLKYSLDGWLQCACKWIGKTLFFAFNFACL